MLKTKAFALLGKTTTDVALAVGVTPSAVSQWPEVLPPRIADRVLAALARKHLAAVLLGPEDLSPASREPDEQGELVQGHAADGSVQAPVQQRA